MFNQAFQTKRQRGMVLITGLIFLLLMTIISMTSVQTTTLDERMANNFNDRNLAFQAAEAALRRAESFILNPSEDVDQLLESKNYEDGVDGTHPSVSPDKNDDDGWTGEISYTDEDINDVLDVSDEIDHVVSQPVYVIQCLIVNPPSGAAPSSDRCNSRYRVTARGQGALSTSVVVLETIVGRPTN